MLLLKNNITGLKMIAEPLLQNSSKGSNQRRRSIDFAFLLASRLRKMIADGWFIYSLKMIEYPPIIGFNR